MHLSCWSCLHRLSDWLGTTGRANPSLIRTPGLRASLNSPNSRRGSPVNQDDYFAFNGDTAGFRACLDTCIALGEFAPTTLHIHKGKGAFQPLDKDKKPLPCDWQLDVINRHWRAAEPNPKGPMYSLELHVWVVGSVDLAGIKVPSGVKTIREP